MIHWRKEGGEIKVGLNLGWCRGPVFHWHTGHAWWYLRVKLTRPWRIFTDKMERPQ